MGKALFDKFKEALASILPLSVLVLILSFTPLFDLTGQEFLIFSLSAVFMIIGIALFNIGADFSMTPMGTHIGSGLTKAKGLKLLLPASFIMGILITVAEPDLYVLADQVASAIDKTALIATVGVGVGLFLFIAVVKIVFKKDLSSILMFFYMCLFAMCAILAEEGKLFFIPLSFDSGGVTTGPVTVPFIMALGVGIASAIGGKNRGENSFGLVALCSIGPILAVMVLSLLSKGDLTYTVTGYDFPSDVGAFFALLSSKAAEVFVALFMIIIFFIVLQITVLKLPKEKVMGISFGLIFTFTGLTVFLTAVSVGFMPIGYKLGETLAENPTALAIMAFVFGSVTVLAEPAVHVLTGQVEDVTEGSVSSKSMMIALALGVGIAICLSVIRIIFNFSILYYLIPGYLISLGLSLFVPKIYTAIAFDSGGVASGPLTSGFILPMAIGACNALVGSEGILSLAFGVVAIVAMTPLITIQLLGFKGITSKRLREKIALRRLLSKEDEQIIDFM